MAQHAVIDSYISTIVSNTSDTDFHIVCAYEGVVPNHSPEIESPIFISVDQDSTYEFDPQEILDVYTDAEEDSPWLVKIITVPTVGKLTLGDADIEILNGTVLSWENYSQLKYTPLPGQYGFAYAAMVIAVKDDGIPSRCWSNPVELIFSVMPENIQPTVVDSSLLLEYKATHPLDSSLFTVNYYDPEGDPLACVVIYTLPPAGYGRLLIDGDQVTDQMLPLTVLVASLNELEFVYDDTGEEIGQKTFGINFEVFDTV